MKPPLLTAPTTSTTAISCWRRSPTRGRRPPSRACTSPARTACARWSANNGSPFTFAYNFDPEGSLAQVQLTQNWYYNGRYAENTYCYDGFGQPLGDVKYGGEAAQAPFDSVGFGGQFGYHQDPETGLYQLGARYYDAGKGRFVNRDPIGYAGGANLYGFCGNNPVNNSDPSGTAAAAVLGAGLRILPNLAPAAEGVTLGTVLAPLADAATIVGGIEATRELYIYGTTGHIAGPIVGQGAEWGSQLGTALYPDKAQGASILFSEVQSIRTIKLKLGRAGLSVAGYNIRTANKQEEESLKGRLVFGMAASIANKPITDKRGRPTIILGENAFRSEQELVTTIFHEIHEIQSMQRGVTGSDAAAETFGENAYEQFVKSTGK